MTQTKILLTQEGHDKLKEELEYLRNTKRNEVAIKIKDAREMGDVLENIAYDNALEEQGYVEGRIIEIDEILNNSQVVSNVSSSKVDLGCTVTVEYEGKKDVFTIVGSVEADPGKRMISHESPVGSALLGAKVGDLVEVKTPIFTAVYKVIEIK
jgi:transcription elongation factor GreA